MRNAKWLLAVAALWSLPAVADVWPSKPIKVVVPYPPGGYFDSIARVVGQKFPELLGQPAVVDNRGGGNGVIGTEFTAKSPGDGYTIMVGGIGPHSINPALYPDLRYDPVRDFAPIIHVANQPAVLVVHPSAPAATIQELLDIARAKPGEINYASNGPGTGPHLSVVMLEAATGTRFNHIPFKGSAPAVTATLGGQTQMLFGPVSDLMAQVRAGKLRPLAVSTRKRLAILPDVPTLTEVGVADYEFTSWFGFFAPAATPPSIIAKLNAEIGKILGMPDVRERLSANGTAEIVGGSPEDLAAFLRTEIAKWRKVIRQAGVKPD